ncbi:cysteine-rich venom protein latisemin-like [Petromyzon marinus]|uniref:cysteine-rich venom protein latisemin-like n=1 Tax=Petromyzon marinus TaxID=7757 RepID=UPI003F720E4D
MSCVGRVLMMTAALAALAGRWPGCHAASNTVAHWKTLKTSQRSVQRGIVNLHNLLRASVRPAASNMLQMSWNLTAAENSRVWANGCSLTHSPAASRKTSMFDCGENLFISSAPFTWNYAIRDWYNEVTSPGFVYDQGPKGPGAVGHYTQVVWYSSFQVGCAVNYCASTAKYFYVCHYCPAGNLASRINRPYNKGNSCGSCRKSCSRKLCRNPCLYKDAYANCAAMKSSYGCGDTGSGKVVQAYCPASCKCAGKIF